MQRFFAGGSFDRLIAFRADLVDQFVNQRRIVRRPDRHRIADIVVQSPTLEIELEMARVFFRTFAAQSSIDRDLGRKRIRARVRTGHCNR